MRHLPGFRPRLLSGPEPSSSQSTPAPGPGVRPKLPRDACITIGTDPPELYVSLTIKRPEHLAALLQTLDTFAPMLEHYRD